MKTIAIIIMTLSSFVFYGQKGKSKYCTDIDYKTVCSDATKLILTELNSLTSPTENNVVEFRVYGNDSMQSKKFLQYIKLYNTATEAELISVIEGSNTLMPAVRAYAYMAYAFRCDQEKRKENPFTNFTKYFWVDIQNGYNVQRDMPFADFKSFCRTGNRYCPYLSEQTINTEAPKTQKKKKN